MPYVFLLCVFRHCFVIDEKFQFVSFFISFISFQHFGHGSYLTSDIYKYIVNLAILDLCSSLRYSNNYIISIVVLLSRDLIVTLFAKSFIICILYRESERILIMYLNVY